MHDGARAGGLGGSSSSPHTNRAELGAFPSEELARPPVGDGLRQPLLSRRRSIADHPAEQATSQMRSWPAVQQRRRNRCVDGDPAGQDV
jgi:hypothetical protein